MSERSMVRRGVVVLLLVALAYLVSGRSDLASDLEGLTPDQQAEVVARWSGESGQR